MRFTISAIAGYPAYSYMNKTRPRAIYSPMDELMVTKSFTILYRIVVYTILSSDTKVDPFTTLKTDPLVA